MTTGEVTRTAAESPKDCWAGGGIDGGGRQTGGDA